VKIAEAKNRSKVFHVEHRVGGRISVEKPAVSRGTVEAWRLSLEDGTFHVEHTFGVFPRLRLISIGCLEPLFEAG
jgi:hypothetical protein